MSGARITNRLPQVVETVQSRAAAGMTQALVIGAAEASVLTPIDTSTLLNSQYREVSTAGGKVRGRVGYTAAYALPVHDPAVKQNFRRATAEKEFLSKGFERRAPEITAALAGAIRV